MGAYINTLLSRNEQVLLETKLSWILYLPFILTALAIIMICALLVAYGDFRAWAGVLVSLIAVAICLAYPWLDRRCNEYAVTNFRVIMKTGIISRNIFEMRLEKIESIDLEQSVGGRIFRYGSVVIHGTGDTARKFGMIEKPDKFRRVIAQAAENVRNRPA